MYFLIKTIPKGKIFLRGNNFIGNFRVGEMSSTKYKAILVPTFVIFVIGVQTRRVLLSELNNKTVNGIYQVKIGNRNL
jgi:hypothetical protein